MLKNVVRFVSRCRCLTPEALTVAVFLVIPVVHDWIVASTCEHNSPVYDSGTHSAPVLFITDDVEQDTTER